MDWSLWLLGAVVFSLLGLIILLILLSLYLRSVAIHKKIREKYGNFLFVSVSFMGTEEIEGSVWVFSFFAERFIRTASHFDGGVSTIYRPLFSMRRVLLNLILHGGVSPLVPEDGAKVTMVGNGILQVLVSSQTDEQNLQKLGLR